VTAVQNTYYIFYEDLEERSSKISSIKKLKREGNANYPDWIIHVI
jgi:hypothetical protein